MGSNLMAATQPHNPTTFNTGPRRTTMPKMVKKGVRVLCVAHSKRLVNFEGRRSEDDLTLVEIPICPCSGRHSFMYEDTTSKEEFKMFWQQAI
jgi:hypothetical protein